MTGRKKEFGVWWHCRSGLGPPIYQSPLYPAITFGEKKQTSKKNLHKLSQILSGTVSQGITYIREAHTLVNMFVFAPAQI